MASNNPPSAPRLRQRRKASPRGASGASASGHGVRNNPSLTFSCHRAWARPCTFRARPGSRRERSRPEPREDGFQPFGDDPSREERSAELPQGFCGRALGPRRFRPGGRPRRQGQAALRHRRGSPDLPALAKSSLRAARVIPPPAVACDGVPPLIAGDSQVSCET